MSNSHPLPRGAAVHPGALVVLVRVRSKHRDTFEATLPAACRDELRPFRLGSLYCYVGPRSILACFDSKFTDHFSGPEEITLEVMEIADGLFNRDIGNLTSFNTLEKAIAGAKMLNDARP